MCQLRSLISQQSKRIIEGAQRASWMSSKYNAAKWNVRRRIKTHSSQLLWARVSTVCHTATVNKINGGWAIVLELQMWMLAEPMGLGRRYYLSKVGKKRGRRTSKLARPSLGETVWGQGRTSDGAFVLTSLPFLVSKVWISTYTTHRYFKLTANSQTARSMKANKASRIYQKSSKFTT